MTKDSARKLRIRGYARDNEVSYTTAMRELDELDRHLAEVDAAADQAVEENFWDDRTTPGRNG